jgi:hypothetical protein
MNPNAKVFIPKTHDKQVEKKIIHVNIISPKPRLQSKLPEWFIKLEY